MELSLCEDLYFPILDDDGIYIDKVPSFKNGLKCPCGARCDYIYSTKAKFKNHISTKTHVQWLEDLNKNKENYYLKLLQSEDIIKQQKIIIAKLEIKNQNLDSTIQILSEKIKELSNKQILPKVGNLIEL